MQINKSSSASHLFWIFTTETKVIYFMKMVTIKINTTQHWNYSYVFIFEYFWKHSKKPYCRHIHYF